MDDDDIVERENGALGLGRSAYTSGNQDLPFRGGVRRVLDQSKSKGGERRGILECGPPPPLLGSKDLQ